MRVHSTDAPYLDRRPWRFDPAVRAALTGALRRRHALIPYLYTAARRFNEGGPAPVRPLYHEHDGEPAYAVPGEYRFGRDLLVAPHLRPRDDETGLARTAVWLPGPGDGGPARWFDLSGEPYEPGWHVRHGELSDVPVYAPAGALVPMAPPDAGIDPPERLRVLAFPGADGAFDLYEDDGETTAYRTGGYAETPFRGSWTGPDEGWTLSVGEPTDPAHAPENRTVEFHLRGLAGEPRVVGRADAPALTRDTEGRPVLTVEGAGSVTLRDTDDGSADGPPTIAGPRSPEDRVRHLLFHADLWSHTKPDVEAALRETDWDALAALPDFRPVLPDALARALVESCHDVGVDRRTDEHDRLVLWNPADRAIRYRFAAWHPAGHPAEHDTVRRGTVPAFTDVDLEAYEGMAWELVVEYGDAATVRYDEGP
jgi:hypothetical protein